MTAGNMFALIGSVDEDMIADAGKNVRKRVPMWVRWGAVAACVCLIAAGALALASREQRGYSMASGSGTIAPGGPWVPEGVDPKIASIAIYPDTEKVQDVLDAEIIRLSEAEALAAEGLGDRLPSSLPEGYAFHRASLYVTTMKSGKIYHMLRVEYRTGDADGAPEDTVTPRSMYDDGFTIAVYDCAPRTDKKIYEYTPIDDDAIHYMIKTSILPREGGFFLLRCGDTYIGIDPLSLSAEQLRSLLDDVTEGYMYQPES